MSIINKNHFTSDEVIKEMSPNDPTVTMIGYVVKISSNAHYNRPVKKYKKLLISNGGASRIQVIAWEENMELLNKIDEMNTIVYIGGVKVTPANPQYNCGNVDFELQIKANSIVHVGNMYNDPDVVKTLNCTILELLNGEEHQKIKTKGFVRTVPRQFINEKIDCTIGSITDGEYKIEIKIEYKENLNLEQLEEIEVIGTLEKFYPGPMHITVKEVDVKKLNNHCTIETLLQGFRNYANK